MMRDYRPESIRAGIFSRIKITGYCLVLILVMAVMGGCVVVDDDLYEPLPVYEVEITSDIAADGDIGLSLSGIYTISSALDTGNVFAGIDPETGEEFRGFLDFPLRGGVDGIPVGAEIESAALEIYISGMINSPTDPTLPFLIDLVDFQPPYLIADDFDRVLQPPLLTLPIDFYPSDVGAFVVIDVTALMDVAQQTRVSDFQLRFLLDYSALSGLIEIDDNGLETAPLLRVFYY